MTQEKKFSYPERIWAGTEHSLAIAMEAHAQIMAAGYRDDEEEEDKPYSFSQEGDVGIISIKGSLTNRDSWYNKYVGVTSYQEIRRALVHAATDASVKAIVLDIDSGGGAVGGVADTGKLISAIDTQLKAVYAITDSHMCSAAYWLGCSAREVYTAETAIMGSIGVIATHMEYSKALKEAGVGVTVIRAGEYKALANSVEPLTETAKQQMQDQLNAAYGVFIGHVAAQRETTVALADQKMGQGREFFGEAAVNAGLADGVMSFDKLLSRVNEKLLDTQGFSSNNSVNYIRGHDMTKRALTEQQIAAMAAGATATDPAPEPQVPATDPEASTEVTQTENENQPVTDPAPAPAADAGVVQYLQGQVTAKDGEIFALKTDLAAAQAQVQSMTASHTALVQIAAKSVSTMKVALKMASVDLSAMSAEQILAEHAAASEAFTKHFKAGGVAAVSTEDKAPAAVDPFYAQRVKATRY